MKVASLSGVTLKGLARLMQLPWGSGKAIWTVAHKAALQRVGQLTKAGRTRSVVRESLRLSLP